MEGYRIPLSAQPPLSLEPISFISYDPSSIMGLVLEKELLELSSKGTVERAPPSPGFYSRMFVVLKASGSWRPIIDQVLDGDRSVRPDVCQAGGLDDFAGPGRCILSGSHPSGQQKVPKVCNFLWYFPIQGAMIRSHHGALSVYKGVPPGKGGSPGSVPRAGDMDQHREVSTMSFPGDDLSGD